jgi:microcystin-dependent protein
MAADRFILPQACCDSQKYLRRIFTKFDSSGKPLRSAPNTELLAGTIIQGTPYVATYNNSDGAWYLQGLYGNPYNVPLAAGMDYWGSTAPNAAFAFPAGQAISRTTYAALFALIGGTYGAGDGSTTFNLPDKTGRVSAMREAVASRLTGTYFGGNSTILGTPGGIDHQSLITANLPPYTPSGSISIGLNNGANGGPLCVFTGGGTNGFTGSGSNASGPLFGGGGVTFVGSFSGASQGGASVPFASVQPTIICNYIMRIL